MCGLKKKKGILYLTRWTGLQRKEGEKKHHDMRIHEIKNTIHSEMKYLVLC